MFKNLRISATNFLKLVGTFEQTGWEVPENDSENESRFNRFCNRLSILDSDEQELVIELTKKYMVINANEYLTHTLALLNRLDKEEHEVFTKTSKFYVLPLIAPQDVKKTKSSQCMWYNFQDENIKLNPIFKGKKLIYCDQTKFSWIKNLKENEMVILLDDYIGSGETAISALNWLTEQFSVTANKIIIISIAAQSLGIKQIVEKSEAKVFTYFVRNRGISDTYENDICEKNINTMLKIERKLKIEKKFQLGYNKSEALISLIRTPNNTFPVFWKSSKKYEYAPFLRD